MTFWQLFDQIASSDCSNWTSVRRYIAFWQYFDLLLWFASMVPALDSLFSVLAILIYCFIYLAFYRIWVPKRPPITTTTTVYEIHSELKSWEFKKEM